MKKVLFVNERLDIGGVQRVTSVITNSLSEYYDVYIYSNQFYKVSYDFNSNLQFHKGASFFKKKMNKGIRKALINSIHLETDPYLLNKKDYDDAISYILSLKVDIVVLVAEWVLIARYLRAKLPNLKIICWLHQDYNTYKNIDFKAHYSYFKRSLSVVDKVIVLTKEDKMKYSKFLDNLEVIYNPITIKKKDTVISNLKNKKIVCVSRLAIEQKGIDYLIEIAKRLPAEWTIELAGNGGKREKKQIRKWIDENNLKSKLILVGSLNDSQLSDLYLSGSIFLLTSRWEGFGLSVTEAMSFGLPVLAFETSDTNAITIHGKYGLLAKTSDIDDICNKLDVLINNSDERSKYQNLSISRSKQLSVKSIVKHWLKILED